MNASTFTTRVVASTQADLFAAVTAGYCRADRAAVRRRTGAGTGNARCDRLNRAHRAVAHSAGPRRAAWDRSSRLSARDPRADVLKGGRRLPVRADLPFAGEVEAYIRTRAAENPEPLDTNVIFHRHPARRAENPAACLRRSSRWRVCQLTAQVASSAAGS
jgi:citrate synthase